MQVFKERALLLPQAKRDNSQPTYRIYDLMHDFAKNLLTHDQYLGEGTSCTRVVDERDVSIDPLGSE